MSTRMRRWTVWTLTLGVIATVASALAWPKPMDVDAARVVKGPLRVSIDADARTRARDRFVVVAPVAGRVERMRVHVGDVVSAGTIIARITPLPLDSAASAAAYARVTQATAALDDAAARARQASLASTLAARMAQRYQAIEAAGGISRQQREQTDLEAATRTEDLAAARARVQSATADLAAARAALPRAFGAERLVTVSSPIRGRVLNVTEESERIVAAGTPLLDLARDADLEIVADVLSEDAVRIPEHADVELSGPPGSPTLRGRVDRIEPAARTRVSALGVEEQRVNVVITPREPLPRVGDGFHLDAHIIVWSGETVHVPASAVFAADGESRLFVIENRRAQERMVKTGRQSDVDIEILAGVAPGAIVVLFPSDRVRSGTRVAPTGIH